MKKNFFAGTEELVARLLSVIASFIFFTIYILSKDSRQLIIEWDGLIVHLFVFWLVYETIGYILFAILYQFSKNKELQEKLEQAQRQEAQQQAQNVNSQPTSEPETTIVE